MKYFNSIDNFPLFNYEKITESNDLRYLIRLPDYFELPNINETETVKLFEVWKLINDEMIDYIGISENYKSVLRIKKQIALLQLNIILTGDKSIETLINIKEIELQGMFIKEKQTIDNNIIALELMLKIQIDINKTTLKKYLNYIKYINKK